MTHNNTFTPLTPAVLHILLALSMEERHGYGIMKQVEMDSRGKVNMGPGTLYGSLKRMLEAGLVKESDKRVDPEMNDERRIYYKMTALGKRALAEELGRYKHLVTLTEERKLFLKTFSYGTYTSHNNLSRHLPEAPSSLSKGLSGKVRRVHDADIQ